MDWTIIIAGLGLLIGAAVLIGQRSAHEQAWRTIARERRALQETRRSLDALTESLTEECLRLQEWEARLVLASERALRRDEPRSS